MLKLVNVNKYFYRHKKNQIHVINNTNLEFEESGLVALLGESGCGKTTLLNAIGGLDKIDSGWIYIEDKLLPKSTSNKKDKMRVLNVGYIFQDYHLLENMTVFDNVALSLKMIGIKDKKEIKRKVEYVLERVNMYRYRNKLAGMLSGGEKQRVGIARAIVKNPKIIIADEPTGNLDSKNTIEVMNIIKSISEEKLVILVTHEKNLAEFYAKRIISLEDGSIINDELNEHDNELDYKIENKFYLKDFENKIALKEASNKIDIYNDGKEKLDMTVVIRGNNIYIRSNKEAKIEVVDDNSNIELIDGHYKKITKKDYEKNKFDLNELANEKNNIKYSSIYSVSSMIKTGFKTVYNYKIIKKILLLGFSISAMFIVFSISNIFGSTKIDDTKFVKTDRHYIKIQNAGNRISEFESIKNNSNLGFVIPGNSIIKFNISNEEIYQFYGVNSIVEASCVNSNYLTNVEYGRMIANKNEVVIDMMTANNAINTGSLKMINIKSFNDLIGKEITIGQNLKFTIVGITNLKSPSIYFDEEMIENILFYGNRSDVVYEDNLLSDYDVNKENIIIKEGNPPRNAYEIIVNINNKDIMPINKKIDYTVNGEKLKVVGYYESKRDDNSYYATNDTISIYNITKNAGMMIYSNNMENDIKYLNDLGYSANSEYEIELNDYKRSIKESVKESLIVASILLIISIIEIFLMVRASFLSRIKEVGIYRAIGTKIIDIYKMFLGEILVITTIASMPGLILMSLILKELTNIQALSNLFLIDYRVIVLSIIVIYILNIIMGLLPIYRVIRKNPAEILARNDVD